MFSTLCRPYIFLRFITSLCPTAEFLFSSFFLFTKYLWKFDAKLVKVCIRPGVKLETIIYAATVFLCLCIIFFLANKSQNSSIVESHSVPEKNKQTNTSAVFHEHWCQKSPKLTLQLLWVSIKEGIKDGWVWFTTRHIKEPRIGGEKRCEFPFLKQRRTIMQGFERMR